MSMYALTLLWKRRAEIHKLAMLVRKHYGFYYLEALRDSWSFAVFSTRFPSQLHYVDYHWTIYFADLLDNAWRLEAGLTEQDWDDVPF